MSVPRRPRAPPRRLVGPPPIRSVDRLPLPVGQRVPVPPAPDETVSSAVSVAVEERGFFVVETRLVRRPEGAAPGTGARLLSAERSVRRVATDTSMRVSLGALMAAGAGLGALEAYLFGGAQYAIPWCLGGLALAGLLWWRYGRTYESEVIVVSVSAPPAANRATSEPTGTGAREHVAWSAGRVRSILFGGSRTAVGVKDCPVPLMDALTGAVRRFEAELRPAVPRAPGTFPTSGVLRPVGGERSVEP